jgi:hypothetical protein
MANVNRLAQKEKTAVRAWFEIYLIGLLPCPAAELTAQRRKSAHLAYPVTQRCRTLQFTPDSMTFLAR